MGVFFWENVVYDERKRWGKTMQVNEFIKICREEDADNIKQAITAMDKDSRIKLKAHLKSISVRCEFNNMLPILFAFSALFLKDSLPIFFEYLCMIAVVIYVAHGIFKERMKPKIASALCYLESYDN